MGGDAGRGPGDVLGYLSGEGPWLRRAFQVRMIVLGVGLGLFLLGVGWAVVPAVGSSLGFDEAFLERFGCRWGFNGTPFVLTGLPDTSNWAYLAHVLGLLGLLAALQAAFLLPRGKWRLRVGEKGRSLVLSAVAGGFVAMLLGCGLLAALLEIPQWWGGIFNWADGWWPVWVAMGLNWLVWAALFWVYWRQLDGPVALGQTVRLLVAGSILELLVSGPIQALTAPHLAGGFGGSKENCYCTKGSYTGLVFGFTALIWLFGPGVAWLALREKMRRERGMSPS